MGFALICILFSLSLDILSFFCEGIAVLHIRLALGFFEEEGGTKNLKSLL